MPQNWDQRRVETHGSRCPECGGVVEGGRGGCQLLFDELTYVMMKEPTIGKVHRLALDTYCMQHVDSYCDSAKSYAAHLIGLCWGIDHIADSVSSMPPLQKLNQISPLIKPAVLSQRGMITFPLMMAKYHQTLLVATLVKAVQEWAQHVWTAYASQHEVAQNWIGMLK